MTFRFIVVFLRHQKLLNWNPVVLLASLLHMIYAKLIDLIAKFFQIFQIDPDKLPEMLTSSIAEARPKAVDNNYAS